MLALDAANNYSAQSPAVSVTIPVSDTIMRGSRVALASDTEIHTRAGSNKIKGTQLAGAAGTVTYGPKTYSNSGTWWYVDFDSGVDGWVQAPQLLVTLARVDGWEDPGFFRSLLAGIGTAVFGIFFPDLF